MVSNILRAEKVKLISNLKYSMEVLFEEKGQIKNQEYITLMNSLKFTYDLITTTEVPLETIMDLNRSFLEEMNRRPKVVLPRSMPMKIEKPPDMNLELTFGILEFMGK